MLNTWAELGNTGWDWDAMGPYYTKAFTLPQIPDALRASLGVDSWGSDSQDTNGPIRLSYPGDSSHPIRKLWAETFKEKGYLMETNPWTSASVGAFSNVASVDPVTRGRIDAAKAYYAARPHGKNLHIVLGAHVDKIIFADGEYKPQAVGVQYRHNGEEKTANASKEVIISAGALQSPKLLELSGIGNPDILKQHDIKVVKELPGVGENLQDHLVCDIPFPVVDELDTLDALARQEPQAMGDAMLRYTQHHDGLLTSSGIMTYAYLPIIDFLSGPGRENLVTLLEENRPTTSPSTLESARAQKYYEIASNTLLDPNQASGAYLSAISQNPIAPDPQTGSPAPPKPGKYLTIASILTQPLSRGAVHLASGDSTQAPALDPRYLSHPLDAEVFARHIQYVETIAGSPPLSSIILKQQPQSSLAQDLDAAKRYIASRAISMWHPAGTCAMLPEQIGGVVSPELKVYGVKNLRVVDASVVPLLPVGNLQSTVYAIAERAADLIKGSYGWVESEVK